MPEALRVAVIGAGIVGASVAWHLARRGARVAVLERAPQAGSGSTGRSAGGLRHQFSLGANVAFSRFSSGSYRRFPEEVGAHAGFTSVGYLFLVPDAAERAWRDLGARARAEGARVEWVDPVEIVRRWSYLDVGALAGGSFGPDDGVLDPHAVTHGYLRGARAIGASIRYGAAVSAIERRGERVRVRFGDERLNVDVVVNAAGPQAGAVAALAGRALPVVPSRRCVYATGPLSGLPRPTPLIVDLASGVWLRSEGERVLFGRSNPDEPDGEHDAVDWTWLEETLEVALPRFPFLERAGLDRRGCWAGLYEMTPDRLPAIGPDPGAPWLVHAAGFSGHGVQHAPATGAAVADVVLLGGCSRFDLRPFDPGRFASGPGARLARHAAAAEAAIV